ncbi:MAG: Arc family DNA-binding protein [Armatimonadetes bacterium]|nr:Arc family DNA-binding protein [Armatimonadota bacterium]
MRARKTFVLRMSQELWDELQRMAAHELRSVNAQIEYLLRDAVVKRGRRLGGSTDEGKEAAED